MNEKDTLEIRKKKKDIILEMKAIKTSYLGDAHMKMKLPLDMEPGPPLSEQTEITIKEDVSSNHIYRISWTNRLTEEKKDIILYNR